MPFYVNLWMKSITFSLPLVIEIAFSFYLKLFFFWGGGGYLPFTLVLSLFLLAAELSVHLFITIRYSILWMLFSFVTYHFILLFSSSLLFMLNNFFFSTSLQNRNKRIECMSFFFSIYVEMKSSVQLAPSISDFFFIIQVHWQVIPQLW